MSFSYVAERYGELTWDDLDRSGQQMVDSAITLSPGAIIDLMNRFDIGREYLA